MSKFTFSIFDGNIYNTSADAWPTHTQLEFEADNDRQAVSAAQELVEQAVDASGAYDDGDEVTVHVWDEDGTLIARTMLTVASGADFGAWSRA